MTYNEIINIAKKLDEETREKIDKEVEERLEILKLGDLDEEEMNKMEECLYMSLVIQEYLDGEYELIDEERALLLEEMAELYGDYSDLLLKAKLEEKVGKKKRMALELMRIREQLFKYKDRMKTVKNEMKENRDHKEKFEELSSKDKMKEVAKDTKEYKKARKAENEEKRGNLAEKKQEKNRTIGIDQDSNRVTTEKYVNNGNQKLNKYVNNENNNRDLAKYKEAELNEAFRNNKTGDPTSEFENATRAKVGEVASYNDSIENKSLTEIATRRANN